MTRSRWQSIAQSALCAAVACVAALFALTPAQLMFPKTDIEARLFYFCMTAVMIYFAVGYAREARR